MNSPLSSECGCFCCNKTSLDNGLIDPMMLAAYSSSMKYNNDCWNLSSIILSHDTRISPKQLQFHYTKQPFLVHLHANFSFIRRPSLFYQK